MSRIVKASILIITLLTYLSANGQADPRWLKSWNEAVQMKPKNLSSKSRIASKEEPGTPLVIKGRVLNPNQEALQGVVIHAYHRDVEGYDFGKNDKEYSTWRLQGWCKTDANGDFEFQTIAPAPDHLGRDGAHIHFTTVTDQYGRQWAPTVFLEYSNQQQASKQIDSYTNQKDNWASTVREVNGVQHLELTIRLKEKGDF